MIRSKRSREECLALPYLRKTEIATLLQVSQETAQAGSEDGVQGGTYKGQNAICHEGYRNELQPAGKAN